MLVPFTMAPALVYVLAVVHTLGAGTDAATPWLQAIMVLTGAPILFLALLRLLPDGAPARTPQRSVFREGEQPLLPAVIAGAARDGERTPPAEART